jgi:hypothetical protein
MSPSNRGKEYVLIQTPARSAQSRRQLTVEGRVETLGVHISQEHAVACEGHVAALIQTCHVT